MSIRGGHPKSVPLTKEEQNAINTLNRLGQRWPKSLWLFSASGSLCVMRSGVDGRPVENYNGANDTDYIVDTIQGIPNDGGDF